MSEAPTSQPKGKGKPKFAKNNKDKGKAEGNEEKPKIIEPIKKLYKIVVRKLPVREFTAEDFSACVDNVCTELKLTREFFRIEHFIEGKISRKRGPVFGAGFITVQDQDQYVSFLANCPSKCPFIAVDDINSQPEVLPAPNQRPYRTKEKPDKYINTYETDPDFLEFKTNLEKPFEKLPSAELQMDRTNASTTPVAQLAQQMKHNPLLKFLREKGERRLQEKRAARDRAKGLVSSSGKSVVVSGVLTKGSSGGNLTKTKKSSSASREPKESKPSSAPSGGNKKEYRLLTKSTLVSSDSPLAASLANVKPISRPSTAPVVSASGDAVGGVADVPKLSRKEREKEKAQQREQRKQHDGVDVTPKEHKQPRSRKEKPPREPHPSVASSEQPVRPPITILRPPHHDK